VGGAATVAVTVTVQSLETSWWDIIVVGVHETEVVVLKIVQVGGFVAPFWQALLLHVGGLVAPFVQLL
jgi:hypothetical protein